MKTVFSRVDASPSQEQCSGWVRNVSDGGVLFETHSELSAGSLIEMRLKLYENGPEQHIRGRVIRTSPTANGILVRVKFEK